LAFKTQASYLLYFNAHHYSALFIVTMKFQAKEQLVII